MTTEAQSQPDILPNIPDAESIQQQLAVVTTEASLLRAQLRVSKRLQRERARLRALQQDGSERHDQPAEVQAGKKLRRAVPAK
jgi:hypothetical protein